MSGLFPQIREVCQAASDSGPRTSTKKPPVQFKGAPIRPYIDSGPNEADHDKCPTLERCRYFIRRSSEIHRSDVRPQANRMCVIALMITTVSQFGDRRKLQWFEHLIIDLQEALYASPCQPHPQTRQNAFPHKSSGSNAGLNAR